MGVAVPRYDGGGSSKKDRKGRFLLATMVK